MKTKNVESGREIEKKYRIKKFDYEAARKKLLNMYECLDSGISTDVFFKSEGNDFVRLRENTKELTVKRTDRGSTLNRMELNLKLRGPFDFHSYWAEQVFGEALGRLRTTFCVFATESAIISLYKTGGLEDVFLEIEVENEQDIQKVEDELAFLGLEREERSLFQIFFGNANES